MLIIGEQEEAEGTVSVRKHGAGDVGKFTLENFVTFIKEEQAKNLN
jgi:threonyl-tRNA synthetase